MNNGRLLLFLGIIPGIGHFFLGMKKKAMALFIVFLGLMSGFIFSSMILIKVLMVMVYFSITVPAWIETYQLAKYGKNKIDTDARWYTVMLLLFTGFAALPLLWQNKRFSRISKILWSIAVPLLAIGFFALLIRYRNELEAFLGNIFS